MQTFLPFPDFRASMAALDDRRLGKQRVETFQLLRALTWPTYAWKNHPAVVMWRGFVPALVRYGLDTCDEWAARGRADATRPQLLAFTGGQEPDWHDLSRRGQLPPWLGDDGVHRSHRSALLRKDPERYGAILPGAPADLPYTWPGSPFPRWPLRRGHAQALHPAEALASLGLDAGSVPEHEVVSAVHRGEDAVLVGATSWRAALAAALATPGPTVWVTPTPAHPDRGPAPLATAPAAAPGSPSRSVARPPSPADLAAVEVEATSEAEHAFYPLASWQGATPPAGAGLLVLAGVQRPDVLREGPGPVPDAPVLVIPFTAYDGRRS